MTQPPPEAADLRFAISQFSVDADHWRVNATALGEAASSARALSIDPLAFGPAAWLGADTAYTAVQTMIGDLLFEGSIEFGAVSDTLLAVRDTYQREEDANVHAIKGVW